MRKDHTLIHRIIMKTTTDEKPDSSPGAILCVVGARPNFMKIAPTIRAFRSGPDPIHTRLVHTGQHYDAEMNDAFFTQLQIPQPDIELDVGSASHAVQTAEIMRRFEPVMDAESPQAVLVVGDVNSTIACLQPLGYLEMLGLISAARLVMTDSGGLQEETTVIGVPCVTLRNSTERPVTVEQGTNTIVGQDRAQILTVVNNVLDNGGKKGRVPELWDGKAAERIKRIMNEWLRQHRAPLLAAGCRRLADRSAA